MLHKRRVVHGFLYNVSSCTAVQSYPFDGHSCYTAEYHLAILSVVVFLTSIEYHSALKTITPQKRKRYVHFGENVTLNFTNYVIVNTRRLYLV